MRQLSHPGAREDDLVAGAAGKSLSQKNQEQEERRSIIAQFFADHSWEKNERSNAIDEWHDAIDDLYKRIDISLLYRIDRYSTLIEQQAASINIEKARERLLFSQEMHQKLSRIYELLQAKETVLRESDSLRDYWLEKMKWNLIGGKIKDLDEDVFFETPKEERIRTREERRLNGEDICGRVQKELQIIQDIRKNFPWNDIPLEITTNVGSFLTRVFRAISSQKED